MSTSSIDRRVRWLPLLLAVVVAGCAAPGRKQEPVDPVNVVKPVREQAAAPVAASTAAHVTPVPAGPEAQAMAPQAATDYFSAIKLMREERYDDALIVLQSLSAQYPALSGPVVNEGLIHLRREAWQEALATFDRALKINDQNPYAWNLRGVALRGLGRFDDARQSYEKALALDPLYAKAHFNLGVLADLYLRDLPLALTHYERYQSLQSKPDQAVTNWIADLRNRSAAPAAPASAGGIAPDAPATPDDAGDAPADAPADAGATGNTGG